MKEETAREGEGLDGTAQLLPIIFLGDKSRVFVREWPPYEREAAEKVSPRRRPGSRFL